MAAHEAPKPKGSGASAFLSKLRRDPTVFGVVLMLAVTVLFFLVVGPISVVLGAAAFFVPRLPGVRLP